MCLPHCFPPKLYFCRTIFPCFVPYTHANPRCSYLALIRWDMSMIQNFLMLKWVWFVTRPHARLNAMPCTLLLQSLSQNPAWCTYTLTTVSGCNTSKLYFKEPAWLLTKLWCMLIHAPQFGEEQSRLLDLVHAKQAPWSGACLIKTQLGPNVACNWHALLLIFTFS